MPYPGGLAVSPMAEQYERHFRSVLGQFATGVAVATAIYDERPVGMTIQSLCSLSLSPPLILFCPAATSTSWPKIAGAGHLCVNLLAEGQEDIARQFARSGGDKYVGIDWQPSADSGSPMLHGALGWIDCRIENVYPGGDHLIVTCRVLDLAATSDLRPLVFFQSGFQRTV